MADREEEELQMALRMSLQGSPPEAKRSKPRDGAEESVEAKNRRLQRELLASAAEKRMKAAENKRVFSARPVSAIEEVAENSVAGSSVSREELASRPPDGRVEGGGRAELDTRVELSPVDADQLFSMVFGNGVSKNILSQWCNQGIRFSSDPETCIGLVQHEGGPCGVLATIQAFVLKYLLFFPDDLNKCEDNSPLQSLDLRRLCQSSSSPMNDFASITEDRKARALVLGMLEILSLCGSMNRAVVATLTVSSRQSGEEESANGQNDEMMTACLEGLSVESASDLQKVLRIKTYISHNAAFQDIMSELPVFQSRMGALLFLISALLSRGLESIQADRDDPSLPLVTAPFGHASQEIVNLLLCGQAVPNVFDGSMDLGGAMSLKGISTNVEVGFLTLLESLNFCKVGLNLKCPRWPIWVVGSESHYTVLFALEPSAQEENELEERETRIRRAFSAQDQSGGGGFISVEGFQQVLTECNVNFPPVKLENLCSSGFIVWSEFWQELLELDKTVGGLKDSSGSMGKKVFDIYHFNGIAKSVLNGNVGMGGESPVQRPRLCKLSVSVPPRWTQEEFLSDTGDSRRSEVSQAAESTQHAPLVDCIRTRWPRAVCSWIGDAPSIV